MTGPLEPRTMQAPGDTTSATAPADRVITPVTLANVLLRYRVLIVVLAGMAFVYVAATGLVRPRTYSAGGSFISQGNRGGSALAGLAAQLGVAVPPVDAGNSPAFYLDLLSSRTILRAVAESRFDFVSDTGRVVGTLDNILGVEGDTPERRREATVNALRDAITSDLSQKSGVISFTVHARYAPLAYQIATRLLDELNRFNLERRQTQAAAERRFAQKRLTEVEGELRSAEDRMQGFLQRNRAYTSSPDLVFEAERLQREIALRQQLFAAISQGLEQAKMEEVRDTPVITVVEQPRQAAFPDRRGLARKGMLALLFGACAGALFGLVREFATRAGQEGRDEMDELRRLQDAAVWDLRHPLKAIARELSNARLRWLSRRGRRSA